MGRLSTQVKKKLVRFNKPVQDLAKSHLILQNWFKERTFMCTQNLARIVQVKNLFTCTSVRIGKICARLVQEFDAGLVRFLQVFYLGKIKIL